MHQRFQSKDRPDGVKEPRGDEAAQAAERNFLPLAFDLEPIAQCHQQRQARRMHDERAKHRRAAVIRAEFFQHRHHAVAKRRQNGGQSEPARAGLAARRHSD